MRSNHKNTQGHFHETSPKPILSHPPLPFLLRPRGSVQGRTPDNGRRAHRRPKSSPRIPGTSLTRRIAESAHPENLYATRKLRNLPPAVYATVRTSSPTTSSPRAWERQGAMTTQTTFRRRTGSATSSKARSACPQPQPSKKHIPHSFGASHEFLAPGPPGHLRLR